jgi:hypothetical protein
MGLLDSGTDYMPDDIMRSIDPRRRRGGLFNMPWLRSAPDVAPGDIGMSGEGDPRPINLSKAVGAVESPEEAESVHTRQGRIMPDEMSTTSVASNNDSTMINAANKTLSDRITAPDSGIRPEADTPDEARMRTLQERSDKMQQPLGWKRRLLQAGLMAAPIALGAAFGGSEGASGAAQGVVTQGGVQQRRKDELQRQLEAELQQTTHNVTTEGAARQKEYEGLPLREAQMRNIESEITSREGFKRNQAPPTITIEDEQGNPRMMQFNPDTNRYDIPVGKGYQKEGKQATDEFERLWASDPKNTVNGTLKKPTLADKIAFENDLAKGKRQPPEASYSPALDAHGRIVGRISNRTGIPEPLPGGTAPEGGFRKTGMGSTQVQREIQAAAITKSYDEISAYVDHHPGLTGPGAGRWQNFETFWGDPSPDAAELRGKIMSYAALQPGLHGMRNIQMVDEIKRELGGLKMTPEALKRGLKGLGQASGAMHQATQEFYGERPTLQNQVDGGEQVEEYVRDPKTNKLVRKQ